MTSQNNISVLINPYSILCLVFISVILIYSLKWSGLYSDLGFGTIIFLVSLIFTSLTLFVLTKKNITHKLKNSIKNAQNERYKLTKPIFLIVSFFLIEIFYNGYIPLFTALNFSENFEYRSFSLPILHLPFLGYTSFIFLKASSNFIFIGEKKSLGALLIIFTIHLLLVSRGSIVFCLLMFLNIFFIKYKFKIKTTLKTVLTIFLSMYLFGILGDFRTNAQIGEENSFDVLALAKVTKASSSVTDNPELLPMYWSYLYASSPLANLQNTIDHEVTEKKIFSNLIIYEVLPDFISRKIAQGFDEPEFKSYINKIIPFLTVATFAGDSYGFYGWFGVLISSLLLLATPIVVLMLTGSKKFHLQVAALNSLMILSAFTNILVFANFSIVMLFIILSSRGVFNFK